MVVDKFVNIVQIKLVHVVWRILERTGERGNAVYLLPASRHVSVSASGLLRREAAPPPVGEPTNYSFNSPVSRFVDGPVQVL